MCLCVFACVCDCLFVCVRVCLSAFVRVCGGFVFCVRPFVNVCV